MEDRSAKLTNPSEVGASSPSLRPVRFGPLWALLAAAASTALCWVTRNWFGLSEQVMVYVVGVLATAAFLSRRDAFLAAVASVAALDYLFVPPVFGFTPTDLRHLWTLLAFMLTSLVVSSYAARVRGQATEALERAFLVETAERAHLLAEAERTRSTLLSAVSHDLRTPLASITGALGALLAPGSTLDEDARRALLVSSRNESERLGRIVTNLLDLARVEAGGFAADKDWFPVEEVVTSAVERVEPRLGGRRIDVDVPEDVIQLRVDGVLIEQVLVNLLENAAKHTPAGRPIELVVGTTPTEVRFEVLDRGPGIPVAEIDRIFEGFHRLPMARGSEGTGLGLALCRAIVRAHQGRIWAENREGGGAALRFSLPREPVPAAPLEDSAGSALEGA